MYKEIQEQETAGTSDSLAPPDYFAGQALEFVISRTEVGYGFSVEGGHGLSIPATISKIMRCGPCDNAGVKAGDVLLRVNDRDVLEGTHKEIVELIRRAGQPLKIAVYRPHKPFNSASEIK